MNTKLPLFALFLGFSLAVLGQKATDGPRKVAFKKEFRPYEWSMMPATQFFAMTGLTPADSIGRKVYRVGLDTTQSAIVGIGLVEAINEEVVWFVEYQNWKEKDLDAVVREVGSRYNVQRNDQGDPVYWLDDALVEMSYFPDANKKKLFHLQFDTYPVYRFVPKVEHALAKLDSTWQDLMSHVTYEERSVTRDSTKLRVTIDAVTPLVKYEVLYPYDGSLPLVRTILREPGGQKALKHAMKQYYDRFFDSFDGGQVWVAETDKPTVRLGVLFDDGSLLHMRMSQADFQEWASDDADE